jgi:hypothetical protein
MENSNQMEYFKYGWKCFQMDEKWKIKKKKKNLIGSNWCQTYPLHSKKNLKNKWEVQIRPFDTSYLELFKSLTNFRNCQT